jgi:hypothetical protein
MTVSEMIARLAHLPADAPVLLVDLNGLRWTLTDDLIALDEGDVEIGAADLNRVGER